MPGSRERQARTIYRPPLNTNLAQSTLSQKAKDRESSSRRDDREQARTCNPSPRAPRSIHPRHQNYSHASELKLASRYTARAQARVAMIASSFDRGAMGASSCSRRDGRELARASEQCGTERLRTRGARGMDRGAECSWCACCACCSCCVCACWSASCLRHLSICTLVP